MSNRSIRIESTISRILVAAIAVGFVIVAIYTFVWLFADSISDNAQDKNVAEFASGLAPYNPQSHYSLAVLLENSFIPEDIPKSLAGFEKAVALSPNDYRLWLALGKARERNGDAKGAELALKKASELAPNYAQVQWAYGNILLRQEKNKEAFNLIGKSVKNDPTLANSAVTTAWQVFDGDVERIKEIVGDSDYTRAALASFLIKEKRYNDAMTFWNSISKKEKINTFEREGKALLSNLINAKKYQLAVQVKNDFSSGNNKIKIGKINNPSFEQDIKTDKPEAFEWQLGKGSQPQIGIDTREKRRGNRSLGLVFGAVNNRDFKEISQVVPVESGTQYELELSYKSNLDTTAKFVWEVLDTSDNKVIASSSVIEEKADWTKLSVNFSTSEETQGIRIRLVRSECGSKLCPTSGRLWFDEFLLN